MKRLGKYTLNYTNINQNGKKKKKPYNYCVSSHVDLAKLFSLNYMAKFTSFNDTDCSALLGLLINVDDSICAAPKFKQMQTEAENMRGLRNRLAHSSPAVWNQVAFNEGFQTMSQLLVHIVPLVNIPDVLKGIEELKTKGRQSIHWINQIRQ